MELRRASRVPGVLALGLLLLAGAARAEGMDAEADRLAQVLALPEGAVVAEIGAGGGEMAAAVAGRVGPDGRVLATELEPEKLERIRTAAQEAGRTNVEAVEAGISDTGLRDGCCDAIFMRYVYHHLTDPNAIDTGLFRALRAGGVLLVIDFPPTWYLSPWTPDGVPANRSGHGIRAADVETELVAAGFAPVQVIDSWRSRWVGPDVFAVEVRRPASGQAAP